MRAVLFHARDWIDEVVVEDAATRQKGWRRMVQFGLVFFPAQIDVVPFGHAVKESTRLDPSMRLLGEGVVLGSRLYPWMWRDDTNLTDFDAIFRGGKLFYLPILTKPILYHEPWKRLDWADHVTRSLTSRTLFRAT